MLKRQIFAERHEMHLVVGKYALAEFIDGAGVDVVFACGELMRSLYGALPASRQGAYAKTAEELQPKLLRSVGPGDAIMIKGSLGTRMAPIVEALKSHLAAVSVQKKD